jgi:hypothetical protein
VDEILEIARDRSRDYVKKVGVDGKVTWVVDREHIARCGLRISALNMFPPFGFISQNELYSSTL